MAEFPPTIAVESAGRGARVVAVALLHDVMQERERLDDSSDTESLHDFRVALRRLRSWLRMLDDDLDGSVPKRTLRSFRDLAQTSNSGRDAEVMLDWLSKLADSDVPRLKAAAQWLTRQQQLRQTDAQTQLKDHVDPLLDAAVPRLEKRLRRYRTVIALDGSTDGGTLAQRVSQLGSEQAATMRQLIRQIHSVDDDEIIHRARIAGKRLRYLLEPLAPHVAGGSDVIARLKELQDVLGDIHDAHAWGAELRNTLQQAAVQEGQALTRMSAGKVAPRRRSRLPSRNGLAALAERIREHGTESYRRLQTEWLGDGIDKFFADAGALLDALGELSAPHVEIERKYLLREFPNPFPPAAHLLLIDQGYLPGERLVERLRRVQDDHSVRHYRTVKVGNGVSRTELEEETTRDIFATMWRLTQGKRLTKRRYVIPDGDVKWEIDQFTDRELVLAEIEMPDENYPVKIPEWLSPFVEREVTGEIEYLNHTLAR